MRTGLYYAALFGLPNIVEIMLDVIQYQTAEIKGHALLGATVGGWEDICLRLLEENVNVNESRRRLSALSCRSL